MKQLGMVGRERSVMEQRTMERVLEFVQVRLLRIDTPFPTVDAIVFDWLMMRRD